jgi:hypothetical protein
VELSSEGLEGFFVTTLAHLNERQRRLVVGAMAEALGRGGQARVVAASAMSSSTVAKAVAEVRSGIGPSVRQRAQFRHLNALAAERLAASEPVISVDTKKELIGNYANGGRQWQPAGEPERVNVHDLADRAWASSPRRSPTGSTTSATTRAG